MSYTGESFEPKDSDLNNKALYFKDSGNIYPIRSASSLPGGQWELVLDASPLGLEIKTTKETSASIVDTGVNNYTLTLQHTQTGETIHVEAGEEAIYSQQLTVPLSLGGKYKVSLSSFDNAARVERIEMQAGSYLPDQGDLQNRVHYANPFKMELPFIGTTGGLTTKFNEAGLDVTITGYKFVENQNPHEFEVFYSSEVNLKESPDSLDKPSDKITKLIETHRNVFIPSDRPTDFYIAVRPLQNKQVVGPTLHTVARSGGSQLPLQEYRLASRNFFKPGYYSLHYLGPNYLESTFETSWLNVPNYFATNWGSTASSVSSWTAPFKEADTPEYLADATFNANQWVFTDGIANGSNAPDVSLKFTPITENGLTYLLGHIDGIDTLDDTPRTISFSGVPATITTANYITLNKGDFITFKPWVSLANSTHRSLYYIDVITDEGLLSRKSVTTHYRWADESINNATFLHFEGTGYIHLEDTPIDIKLRLSFSVDIQKTTPSAQYSINEDFSTLGVTGNVTASTLLIHEDPSDNRFYLTGTYGEYRSVQIVNGSAGYRLIKLERNGERRTEFLASYFPSGTYYYAVKSNGNIIVGGGYSSITPENGSQTSWLYIAEFSGATGARLSTFGGDVSAQSFNNVVNGIACAPDDKIYVRTNANSYRGETVGGLCRLNSDGSLDASFQANIGTVSRYRPHVASLKSSEGAVVIKHVTSNTT